MASPRSTSMVRAVIPLLASAITALGVFICLAAPPAARAAVSLRFTPPDTTLLAGESYTVAVVIDDPLDLRTVDLTVHYDPAVLGSVDGGPGSLFDEIFVWQEFIDDEPGVWSGVVVGMGPAEYIVGPGEIYVWNCTADALGCSGIEAIEVSLYTGDGELIVEEILLDRARVQVTDELMTPVTPILIAGPALKLYPNPFNAGVRLEADGLAPGSARVDVYDLKGRLVETAWSGILAEGGLVADWKPGRSGAAMPPSGTYLFVLRTADGTVISSRGILLK